MAGEQVKVEQKSLFQNRDYPVINEYRAVLSGVFHTIYGLQARSAGEGVSVGAAEGFGAGVSGTLTRPWVRPAPRAAARGPLSPAFHAR